jgi:hypothetical protein
VGRSPVKVELGHEVSADDVVDLNPDAVVVANGGQVVLPRIPGSELPHVHTGQALRERFGGWRQRLVRPKAVRAASKAWMPLGHRVVIVAPTWSRWNSPNSSPRVGGWCRCSRPIRRSRRNWATSARPNTWTGSTGWGLRCM